MGLPKWKKKTEKKQFTTQKIARVDESMLEPDESIDNAKNLIVKKNIKAFYFDCDDYFLLKFVRFLQKWS